MDINRKKAREKILGFKARMELREPKIQRATTFLTNSFGTITFLAINAVFFLIWIVINTSGFSEGLKFDAFPFPLLTTIVSLEAIFLSIIVLITQNRESKIADLRQELDFEINVQAEEEITRILHMVDEIHDYIGLSPEDDRELTKMKKRLDVKKLGEELSREN